MASASAIVNINGSPIPVAANGDTGFVATPGNTVVVTLATPANVEKWVLAPTSSDGNNPNTTPTAINTSLVPSLAPLQYTFTAPALYGAAGGVTLFTSTVTNQYGSFTYTFNVYVIGTNISGARPFAGGQNIEGNIKVGMASDLAKLVALNGASGPPTGSAGGDLYGSFPNPGVGNIRGIPVKAVTLGSTQDGYVATWVNSDGYIEFKPATGGGGGSGITALTGDVTASGTGSVTATLATVNSSPGSFGSTTSIPVISVNGKGLVTAVSTAIPTVSAVSGITVSGTPTSGQVLTATSSTAADWATPSSGSGVTWANDLAGSTSINQYVVSLSGAGGSGTIAINSNSLYFASALTSPSLSQLGTSSGAGATLVIEAQSTTAGGGAAGGNLLLSSGPSASGSPGTITLCNGFGPAITIPYGSPIQLNHYTTAGILTNDSSGNIVNYPVVPSGTPSSGQVLTATSSTAAHWATPSGSGVTWANDLAGSTSTSQYVAAISGSGGSFATVPINTNTLQFGATFTIPQITQATTSTGSGVTLYLQAQSATGASHNGGNLVLSSGSSGSATAGNITLRSGATTVFTAKPTGVIQLNSYTTAGILTNDSSGNIVNYPVIPSGTPSSGQVLTATSGTTANWQSPSGSGVTFANDLAGSTSTSQYVAAISGAGGSASVPINTNSLYFASALTSPSLTQQGTSSGAGATLIIGAQSTTASTAGGGNLLLNAGSSATGTPGAVSICSGFSPIITAPFSGPIQFNNYTTAGILTNDGYGNVNSYPVVLSGTPSSGQVLIATSSTAAHWSSSGGITWANDLAGSTSTDQYVAAISGNAGAGGTIPVNATNLQFGSTQSSPQISQVTTSAGSGNTLTIQAQPATGAGHSGGSLILVSGTSAASTAGKIELQVGSTLVTQYLPNTGSVNGQITRRDVQFGTARTLSSATVTTVCTYVPPVLLTSGYILARCSSKAITAPTSGNIGDFYTTSKSVAFNYNGSGVLTIVGSTNTLDTNSNTSLSTTAFTITTSSGNIVVQVANVASATIDSQVYLEVVLQ